MEFVPSPNFWQGRNGHKPIAIVIHMTEGAYAGALSWLTNRRSQVSAHYLVGKEGQVVQLVADENTAWHAGRVFEPTWKLLNPAVNPNYYTIGIEHENLAGEPMTTAQWQASTMLIMSLAKKHGIPIDEDHIIKHRSIFARKSCPGRGICLGS